ncbi:family 1 glycosyl transferase [Paenibacillus sp. 32O-W]|jgi:Glycosyltransferase|uniref:glycosyltransferase n=1 Tax=Paenibacillus sp. 32O-W TaxID=1695218 RepID=UPI0007209C84|nr:glycosyltransferase [Paenibacillus sp. 32O-W]ALS29713.1 family 1 glycosyl transferase [Paenibacillus sp. 32O-W]
MERILLFDTINSGHRLRYNVALLEGISSSFETAYVSTAHPQIRAQLQQLNIPYHILTTAFKHYLMHDLSLFVQMLMYAVRKKYKQIHIASLDSLLIALSLFSPVLYLLRFKITGTLHWYPHRKSKAWLLKFLIQAKIINKMVVHGDFMKELIVQKHGEAAAGRVFAIPYPHLHDKEQHEDGHGRSEASELMDDARYARPFLLAFGGLRHDKGLDLLLEAIEPLGSQPFTLFIVGKEEDFGQADIERFLRQNPSFREKIVYKTEYIADREVAPFFKLCDAVILPYRKVFTGQSGPFTEGVANGKWIIGPDHGEIGYTIREYRLGYTFEAEDVKDLTKKITTFIALTRNHDGDRSETRRHTYLQQISPASFVKNYHHFFMAL